jgi:hypothetical protein
MAENCFSIELAAILCLLPPAVELHQRKAVAQQANRV